MTENPSIEESLHNLPELSVGQLSRALKNTLEESFSRVRVRGEISGLKLAASGHMYLRLKDDNAVLDGVCWKGTVGRLSLDPEDGIEIIATGRITSYAPRSSYQIVIDAMELAGEGALLKILENRKRKLAAEGLFEENQKQSLPFLPQVIGVVSSPAGAVIQDILHRLSDRFPVRVILWPVVVQGNTAASEICDAINSFTALDGNGKIPRPDLLIVARGGGSLEDLMAFNEEDVVRATAACSIPLISAVGHETDTTLIDFAADVRAPTPTAAAEMAVPVRSELLAQVIDDGLRLLNAMNRNLTQNKVMLDGLGRGLPSLRRVVEDASQRLDDWGERLENSLNVGIESCRSRLAQAAAAIPKPDKWIDHSRLRLDSEARALFQATKGLQITRWQRLKQASALLESFSYQRVLERGFALVSDSEGNILASSRDVVRGTRLSIRFYDGKVSAKAIGDSGKKLKSGKSKMGGDGNQGSLL
ncbi:MAG: exodeoxyribonuclease VII large subunit [Magnetovibrio sp.]|nr:exodeoxyribonuclease VII large subunit [Magnetovibrio sp.]|tara:strand:+ start:5130 stop:6557 length:1428 start_codon:yes stop_codon:yes gene_type:complete